ncbi:hypothetical protein ACLESO_29845 [Pyxidicoccus sp. 3LG]
MGWTCRKPGAWWSLCVVLMMPGTLRAKEARGEPKELARIIPGDIFDAPAGAVSPDGHSIAVTGWYVGRGGRISVLDVKRHTQRRLGPDLGSQWSPVWAPDGRRLAFVDTSSARRGLWVHELATGRELRLHAPATGQPAHPRWTGDGKHLFFTLRDGARMEVWRVALDGTGAQPVSVPSSRATRGTSPEGRAPSLEPIVASWPAPAPAGQRLAALRPAEGGASTLWVWSLATGEARQLTPPLWPSWTGGPVWSPDGRSLYLAAASESEGALEAWAVDVASGKSRRLEAPSPGEVLQVSVTREGAPVLAVQELHVRPAIMSVEGGIPRPLFPRGAVPGFLPSWSPDGRTLAYTSGSWRRRSFPRGLDIAALPLDERATPTGPPSVLIAEDHEDYGVAWSPDGRFLAFHSHRGDTDDVYLRPARPEDGPVVALSSFGPGHETGEPTWSPGGRQVVFSSFTPDSHTGRSRLFTVDIDPETGRPTGPPQAVPMVGFEGDAIGGRYSPDGLTLSFHARFADGSSGVCTVPVTGGEVRTVVRHRSIESYGAPEWSRDGMALFFASAEESSGVSRIQRVHLPTGQILTLSEGRAQAFHPRLSPDGRSLAVTLWLSLVEFWRLPPPPVQAP